MLKGTFGVLISTNHALRRHQCCHIHKLLKLLSPL